MVTLEVHPSATVKVIVDENGNITVTVVPP